MMAKRVATVVGITLLMVGLVMLVIPVWLTVEGAPRDTCGTNGGIGVIGAFTDTSNDTQFEVSHLCDAAAASRLYHATPWIVIGIGALFFPKPKRDEEGVSA